MGATESDPQNAYRAGSRTVMLALYHVLQSVMTDSLHGTYPEKEIKEAAANVTNRLTMRAEPRADPRLRPDSLGREIASLTELQMVREAAALVLVYDAHGGPDLDERERATRLAAAEAMAGESLSTVLPMVSPGTPDPSAIERLAEAIGARLLEISALDGRRALGLEHEGE